MKAGVDAGRDPFSVLVDCQDHVVATAAAWVDLVVLEAFADAVERCPDPALRAVLDRLCSLHALHRIEAERGWYLEHGRLSPARSKAVTRAVNALCGEVRQDAALLVEAFGVPDQALGDALSVATAGEAVPA
jgi:acyl-CoA oxidase